MTRDPRTDPRPGDFVRCVSIIRVDSIAFQRVLGVVFRPGSTSPSAILNVSMAEWVEAVAGAEVVFLSDDDRRHHATILRAT
jgi:hypothetical protein